MPVSRYLVLSVTKACRGRLRPLASIGAFGVAILGTLAAAAPDAVAQNYPTGPMRIVVPFVPGGGTDILSRMIAQKLNEAWGQPVVVDNRPGAGGTVGTALVAKAKIG